MSMLEIKNISKSFRDGSEENHVLSGLSLSVESGEKQRVAIARAFVNDPEIILADEPTASLDAKRGRVVVQMIRDEVKKRGKVAVVVTHDERILDLMDKVYRLENGRLTEISNS